MNQNESMRTLHPKVAAMVLGTVLPIAGSVIYLFATSSPLGSDTGTAPTTTASSAVAVSSTSSLSAVAKANVIWTPTSIAPILSPGETVTMSVSFLASKNIRIVSVETSSSLAKLIHVQPASFEHIRKGQPVTLNVIAAPTANARLGTVTGTIQLRRGKVAKNDPDCNDEDRQDEGKLLSQALNVTINVWHLFTDSSSTFTMKYPPQLVLQQAQSPIIFSTVNQPKAMEGDPGEEIQLTILPRGDATTLDEWLETYYEGEIDFANRTIVTISNAHGVTFARIRNVPDLFPDNLSSYALTGNSVVQISLSPTGTLMPIYDGMLQTLSFSP